MASNEEAPSIMSAAGNEMASVAGTPEPRRAGGIPDDELTPSPPRAPVGTRSGKARAAQSGTPPSAAKSQTGTAVATRLTKTKMCYFFEQGKCGSTECRFAHSKDELRTQPVLQKTKICKSWQEGRCDHGSECVFAHGESELRVTEGIYKTQMCHFFERGRCLKGARCNHAHGPEDMQRSKVPGSVPALPNSGASDASVDPSPLKLASLLGDSPPPARPSAFGGLAEIVPPPPMHIDPFGFPSALWPQLYGLPPAQDYDYGFLALPGSPWASQAWGTDPFMPPLMPPPCPVQEWDSNVAVLDQVLQNVSGLRSKIGNINATEGSLKAPIAVSLAKELAADAAKEERPKNLLVHRI